MALNNFDSNDFKRLEKDCENGLFFSFQVAFIRLYKEIYVYNSHEDYTYQETYGYKVYLSYDGNYDAKIKFDCTKDVFDWGRSKVFYYYDEEVRKGCKLIKYPVTNEKDLVLTKSYRCEYYEEVVFYNSKCICGQVF